jgi:multiple sugar transport system substrate-binding protein
MVAVSPDGLAQVGKLAAFTDAELEPWVSPKASSYDGVTYQLPTNTQTIPMVYYQKAHFETAGIESAPQTWDEFLAACDALNAVGITPLVVGSGGADTWANGYSLVALFGTEVYAKDPNWLQKLNAGETDFSDPLFVNAATKLKQLVDNECIQTELLSNDYAGIQAAFLDGAGAMYPMGSWFTVAPNAQQQAEIGVFTWPSDDGTKVAPAFTGGGLSVSSSAPDVDRAKQWAIAFSTLESNMDAGVKFDALFIDIKGYEAPTDVTPLYAETLAELGDAQANGVVTPSFLYEQGSPSLLGGFSGEVYGAIAEVLNGRMDVDAFVQFLNETYSDLAQ